MGTITKDEKHGINHVTFAAAIVRAIAAAIEVADASAVAAAAATAKIQVFMMLVHRPCHHLYYFRQWKLWLQILVSMPANFLWRRKMKRKEEEADPGKE